MTLTSAINIIPGQSGTYRHLQHRVADLLADSGQTFAPYDLSWLTFLGSGQA
jgi:hypothetical protein